MEGGGGPPALCHIYIYIVVVVVVEGTQHVPAGEIARHALPGQGAREQSAGVTLAGRVPTTTEGGGGRLRVGGRVWRRVGPPEDVTLEPSPVSRGGSYSSCAKRLWRGRRVER